jgi:low affinity Fe/Cu permease
MNAKASSAVHRLDLFTRVAGRTTRFTGGKWGFSLAAGLIAIWAVTGPVFHYSEMWQLVVNTGTSVITFLMVFLIQNSQNRESRALHLKIDELLFAVEGAQNEMIDIENLSPLALEAIAKRYEQIARDVREAEADLQAASPLLVSSTV